MPDDVPPTPADELDVLHAVSARIRAAQPTDPLEVERVLEAGFAAMMALEAELSRRRRAGARAVEPGTRPVEEIQTRISELRDALTELRTLAVPPGESRVGYGFVLPDQRGQAQSHRN